MGTYPILYRCGLGPLFSSQLLPHSHTASNQSRTTNNIDVYLYKKIHYNATLTKPTKRKEIRTNLYLFQFHIALKIGLGGSGKRDWLCDALLRSRLWRRTVWTLRIHHFRPTPKQTNLKATIDGEVLFYQR
jgi:hypothetical protein